MTRHPILDTPRVSAHDPQAFWQEMAGFPGQCRAAQDLPVPRLRSHGEIRQILVLGMGGSAAGGDLLRACVAGRLSLPIQVSRGEGLPPWVGPETLLIAVSYSGG
jgi:glucose/mannose-6-phosphate isomerase